jgi:hypothetical protein
MLTLENDGSKACRLRRWNNCKINNLIIKMPILFVAEQSNKKGDLRYGTGETGKE